MQSQQKKLFWLSLLITLAPLIIYSANTLQILLVTEKVTNSIFSTISTSPRVLISIIYFLLITLLIHVIYSWLVVKLWCNTANYLGKLKQQELFLLAIFVFVFLQIGLVATNSLVYPRTSLVVIYPEVIVILAAALTLIMLAFSVNQILKVLTLNRDKVLIILALTVFTTAWASVRTQEDTIMIAGYNEPDVIIIGIDSLRPDHLGLDGDSSITPNMDEFFNSSVSFSNAYTPIARTYPAWISILTGKYPFQHGARFNLQNTKNLVGFEDSLTHVMKKNGYQTAYSIDEARFSNINESYGFDHSLTPEIGAGDFLLAPIDFIPLVNLVLTHSNLGKLFYPYHYMNRASAHLYEPDVFSEQLDEQIASLNLNKPLFMVTHFELPHWPYKWKSMENNKAELPVVLESESPPIYQLSLKKADEQFGKLLESLEREGRLDNAIVILLSDHGEGFAHSAKKYALLGDDKQKINSDSYILHGNNVLDEAQNKVVLAFKVFGQHKTSVLENQEIVSLVDIYPTVMDFMGYEFVSNPLGCTLSLYANKPLKCGEDRFIFNETGFYSKNLRKVLLESSTTDLVNETAKYYQVNENTQLTIKDEYYESLIKSKQFAVFNKESLFAFIPNNTFLLADKTSHYYELYKNPEYEKGTMVETMFRLMCDQYAIDNPVLNEKCLE